MMLKRKHETMKGAKPMKRGYIVLIVMLLVVALISGCNWGQDKQPPNTPSTPNTPNTPNTPDAPTTEMVVVYYVNHEYAITGNADLDPVLPVEREYTGEGQTIEAFIVEQLQIQPEEQGLSTELARLVINNVYSEGDTAYVDFSSQNLNGGSLQESLVISQLVQSLTALNQFNQVQILVDGKITETLMGHISIAEPLNNEQP